MTEPVLEPFFPDRTSGENLAVQLARRLREAITSGALASGTRMLGTRQLAERLGLGRNTVALAYEQLTAEGYFETRVGAGTFVAASGAKRSPQARAQMQRAPQRARRLATLRDAFAIAAGDGPLRPGMPDLANFPSLAWERAARAALRFDARELGYTPAYGMPALREAIATHVAQFRGVAAHADNVIVVEGAQAAFYLAALVFASPGDAIALEDPCYALARVAFDARGLLPHAVPVDGDGLQPNALPDAARLAFVTPTHQFPLGGTLPLARRLALLAWARRADAYVIEDDYDSEFTSRTQPLPALQSLDPDGRVIYVGSFSKTLAPGLRLGYAIVPPSLVSAFRAARAATSLGVALHLQQTTAAFIANGHFARHIRRMNRIYERRRALLLRELAPLAAAAFEIGPAQTGLHVALRARGTFDDVAFARSLAGQRLVALSPLCIARRDCRGFILGFANGSDTEVERAARALSASARRGTRSRSRG
jgi:GntR family transcriptional regulator / MocR family aminotransferase